MCPFFISSGIRAPQEKKTSTETKFQLNKKIKRLVRFLFAELNNKFNLAVELKTRAMETKTDIYTGLKYTTSEVNMNFKIKVHTTNKYGKNMNTLVGVAGLIRLIGVEMTNKFLDRSFKSMQDRCTCKLRGGVRVTFYAH